MSQDEVKVNWLVVVAILIFIVGFFGGKIYTDWDVGKNHICFDKIELEDICDECINEYKEQGGFDWRSDFILDNLTVS
jgi:hypothetical protein